MRSAISLVVLCVVACVALSPGGARAQAPVAPLAPGRAPPTRLWTAGDLGYAMQLALAVGPTHVFVPEAYSITAIERATGAVSTVRVEEYLPVSRAVFADGRLWIAHGSSTDHTLRISALDPATGALTRVAALHAPACGLRWAEGELWWWDPQHLHHVRPGGAVRTLATAPRGAYFEGPCGEPLALGADAAYVVLAPIVAAYRADRVVRVPRDGGALEVLADGVVRGTRVAEAPGGVVIARAPGPEVRGSIALWSAATRTETILVPELRRYLDALAVIGGHVVWADGNYYAEDEYRVTRVPLAGGATELLVQGDRRIFDALAVEGGELFFMVQAHPPGECEEHYEGCGQGGEMRRTCSQPDHQLYRMPLPR